MSSSLISKSTFALLALNPLAAAQYGPARLVEELPYLPYFTAAGDLDEDSDVDPLTYALQGS